MSASGHFPEDVRHAPDRRGVRTRASIDDAFLMLLRRKGYDAIAVSEVVQEANIGRATFYEHYASKDDLLRAQLRRVVAATLHPAAGAPSAVDATALFKHIRDVPMLYRLVGGRHGTARSSRVLQDVLEERVLQMLQSDGATSRRFAPPWTAALASRVTVAALCAMVSWWVDGGMAATVEEMQTMFGACGAAELSA